MSHLGWQYPVYAIKTYFAKCSKYCLCIFTLNETGRLQRQLQKIQTLAHSIDIIIADGGSTDGCTEDQEVEPYGVRVVLTKQGAGQLGAQMRMAFAYALHEGYEGVIVVDGNDKDDVVRGLSAFIQKLEEGFDHVQGSRFISGGVHENTPLSRWFAVRCIHAPLISIAAQFRYTDTTNGFRAYSRRLLEDPNIAVFRDVLSGYELHYYLAIESARRNFKVCEIPVTRCYPKQEKTPTKISPFLGNLNVLKKLFLCIFGAYRPTTNSKRQSFFSEKVCPLITQVFQDYSFLRDEGWIFFLVLAVLIYFSKIYLKLAPSDVYAFKDRVIGGAVLARVNAGIRTFHYLFLLSVDSLMALVLSAFLIRKRFCLRKLNLVGLFELLGVLGFCAAIIESMSTFSIDWIPAAYFLRIVFLLFFLFVMWKVFLVRKKVVSTQSAIAESTLSFFMVPTVLFLLSSVIMKNGIHFSRASFIVISLLTFFLSCFLEWFRPVVAEKWSSYLKSQFLFLIFVPVFIVCAQEVQFLISGASQVSVKWIFSGLLVLFALFLFLIRKKYRSIALKQLVLDVGFPVAVFTVYLFHGYQETLAWKMEDWFHLPEMLMGPFQFSLFHQLPWFDFYPTHGLSDYPLGYLLGLFSVGKGIQSFAWSWLEQPILSVFSFHFFKKLTTPWIALVALLVFHSWVIPIRPFLVFVLIFSAFLDHKKTTWMRILTAYGLWTSYFFYPAVGVPVLGATILCLLWLMLIEKKSFFADLGPLFLGAGVLGCSLLPFFWHSRRSWVEIIQLWSTFLWVQAQSMSYETLSRAAPSETVQVYLLLPALFMGLVIYFARQTWLYPQWRSARVILVFFLVLYFSIEFNRKLQRHCLVEGFDTNTFFWLMIPFLAVLLFTYIPSSWRNGLACFGLATFTVLNEVSPLIGAKNVNFHWRQWNTQEKREERVYFQMSSKPEEQLTHFFKQHLKPGETFYDFSNTLGIYLTTAVQFPTFFIPTLYHTSDSIQKGVLHDLELLVEKNQLKYVLFRGTKNRWYWNAVDGVPNEVRSFRIAEWIYLNFKPCAAPGGYEVWCHKEDLKFPVHADSHLKTSPQVFHLKHLPWIWGQFDPLSSRTNPLIESFLIQQEVHAEEKRVISIPHLPTPFSRRVYLHLRGCAQGGRPAQLSAFYGNEGDSYTWILEPCEPSGHLADHSSKVVKDHLIRMATQYHWLSEEASELQLMADTEWYFDRLSFRKALE